MSDVRETEIGYLCGKGHYLFYADSEETESCGSKRVAGIYLRLEATDDEWAGESIADIRQEADDHLRRVIDLYREAT
jgi:hypothetical protein